MVFDLAVPTCVVQIFMSGPIEAAKQTVREYVQCGLCVTVEPTVFIYTGGEETGYVVGLRNYPKYPSTLAQLTSHALTLAELLRSATFQDSYMVAGPQETVWHSNRAPISKETAHDQ